MLQRRRHQQRQLLLPLLILPPVIVLLLVILVVVVVVVSCCCYCCSCNTSTTTSPSRLQVARQSIIFIYVTGAVLYRVAYATNVVHQVKMSSLLSATNDALTHPSAASPVTDDVMTSDDNNVKSSLDASCNCSAVEPSHTPQNTVTEDHVKDANKLISTSSLTSSNWTVSINYTLPSVLTLKIKKSVLSDSDYRNKSHTLPCKMAAKCDQSFSFCSQFSFKVKGQGHTSAKCNYFYGTP